MATITEDYVSFETAKLLKEKEFDIPCWNYYDTVGNFTNDYLSNHNFQTSDTSAPTIQMVMKWLRDIYNLFIEIQCYGCEYDEKAHFEYSYVISEYVEFNNDNVCTTFGLEKRYAKSQFLSYEEACEASIKYCLEHLI